MMLFYELNRLFSLPKYLPKSCTLFNISLVFLEIPCKLNLMNMLLLLFKNKNKSTDKSDVGRLSFQHLTIWSKKIRSSKPPHSLQQGFLSNSPTNQKKKEPLLFVIPLFASKLSTKHLPYIRVQGYNHITTHKITIFSLLAPPNLYSVPLSVILSNNKF